MNATERLRRQKQSGTKPELRLRALLRRMGYGRRYRVNTSPTGWKRGPWADAIIPSSKLAIFVHGCFWHGCSLHYRLPKTNQAYWIYKLGQNRERDSRVCQQYLEHGWGTAVLWECESDEQWERELRCVLYG